MDELLVIETRLSRGLAGIHDVRTLYAVDAKGDGGSSAVIREMSANRSRGVAASAIRKTTRRPWLTTLAPIWMSFSLSVVGDHSFIDSGVAKVRTACKMSGRGHLPPWHRWPL